MSRRRGRRFKAYDMVHAWSRLEDLNTCGRCRWIRKKLETIVEADAGSNPAVKLSRLIDLQVYCARAGAVIRPLDPCCALWQPAENSRVIWVERD